MCDATLADQPHGLTCTRPDPHQPHHGCTYESTSGLPHAPKEEL